MRNSSFYFDKSKDAQELRPKIKKEIFSYRVSSVFLRKSENLHIRAAKKMLSPIPSKQLPKLTYIYTPKSKECSFFKPKKNFKRKYDLLVSNNNSLPKTKWFEKHYSCFEKYQPRSKSIQDNYKKPQFRPKKASMVSTCEISLQT